MTRDDNQSEPDALPALGTSGASARARYDALQARDASRRRRLFGPLAPLVSLLLGPKRSTEAWAKGAQGEELIGPLLARSLGDKGIVLHDRRIPRSRANLDHIAIVPWGVWVIDTKHYRGRLQLRTVRGNGLVPHRTVFVGRFDKSALIRSARRQRTTVARHLPPDVSVRAVLCFTGVELGFFARPFVLDGVLVTWPKPLARTLRSSGPLDNGRRHEVATALARAFPPYQATA